MKTKKEKRTTETFRIFYDPKPSFHSNLKLTPGEVLKNFVEVKEVQATGLDEAYRMMQAEVWSPLGEASELIRSKGLQHTSMSIGDVIQKVSSREFFQVMEEGFSPVVPSRKNSARNSSR
jgi:hypothetical protein